MGARKVGHMVQYGKSDTLPRFLVKKVNLANPLGGLDPSDLFRPSALAYEDGYADGRQYGLHGKFMPDYYSREDVQQYAAGFKAGCAVYEHLNSLNQQVIHNLLVGQEV